MKDYTEMSKKACSLIIDKIKILENPVLGLATGSTPEGLYQYLIEAYSQGKVSFKQFSTFNLDEYVGLDREDLNSYHFYMKDKLFGQIDLLPENAHVPNGNAADLKMECEEYENQIQRAGQVDIQVLGLGLNGHIGFNEPGTPFSSRTQAIDLTESTRRANARFFASLDEVPTQAITMGIDTIMESKQILLEEEILNLLKVSTGDSWVVRNWGDVSEWTAATALSVLLKDLIATYNQGIKHNVSMPFNALSSTQLFDSMGKEKPKA